MTDRIRNRFKSIGNIDSGKMIFVVMIVALSISMAFAEDTMSSFLPLPAFIWSAYVIKEGRIRLDVADMLLLPGMFIFWWLYTGGFLYGVVYAFMIFVFYQLGKSVGDRVKAVIIPAAILAIKGVLGYTYIFRFGRNFAQNMWPGWNDEMMPRTHHESWLILIAVLLIYFIIITVKRNYYGIIGIAASVCAIGVAVYGRGGLAFILSAGTAAVHLALIACGVSAGDEVIVQSFTFCASANPVTYLGATPVFVDSEPQTWNMDPELMETAIKDRIAKTGRKPKAIVPVALYGMPYQIDRIMEIADRYGIPVIEDAAEGFGSRYKGQVLGTFGQYGVLSFNGNKMITTSGGGALICPDMEARQKVMWLATQAREGYPYYQHEAIGYNYRMSNICAGIGRGQMTVLDGHIAHHQHVHELYCELLKDVKGITVHSQPHTDLTDRENFTDTTETTDYTDRGYDSNYWLTTILLDEDLRVKHEERAYAETVKGAVGGAAGMVHQGGGVHTDCEPGNNVEAMRLALDSEGIESRPLWKPMHRQPVFREAPAYVNGVSEALFKKGLCLPSGPMVSDDDVKRIVKVIKDNIVSE